MLLATATHAPADGSCDLTYHEFGPLTCWSTPVKPAAVQAARAAVTVDPTKFGTFLQLGVGAGVGVGLGVGVGVRVGVAVAGGVGPDLPAGVAVAAGGSGVAPLVVVVPSGVTRSVDVGTELGSWDAVAPPYGAADGEPVASDAALATTARAGVGVASVDPAVDPSGPPKARPSSARATTSVPIASGARMSGRRPTVDGPDACHDRAGRRPACARHDRSRHDRTGHDGRRNARVVRRPDGQQGGRRVADATARAGAIRICPAPATGVDLADQAVAEPDLGADGVLVDGPAAALADRSGWLARRQRRIRRAQHGASMSNARGLGWAVRRDRAVTGREDTARHNLRRAVSDSERGPKLGLRSSSCDPETYGWMSRLKPPLSWRPGRAAGKAG